MGKLSNVSSAIHVYSIINDLFHVQKLFAAKNCIYHMLTQDTTRMFYTAAC
jgi:hypothetical protein